MLDIGGREIQCPHRLKRPLLGYIEALQDADGKERKSLSLGGE